MSCDMLLYGVVALYSTPSPSTMSTRALESELLYDFIVHHPRALRARRLIMTPFACRIV